MWFDLVPLIGSALTFPQKSRTPPPSQHITGAFRTGRERGALGGWGINLRVSSGIRDPGSHCYCEGNFASPKGMNLLWF